MNWTGRLVALGLLILALPGILVLMALVRLTSAGPALYRQRRVGWGGREFTLIKLRTMRIDAETRTGPVWTSPHDPRVTPVGRFLRVAHLDEFPQLWNIVCGDMALVGPRPERPEFVQILAREVPGYLQRLAALPGITGLAQINLPPDSDLDSVRRKLLVDMQYISQRNAWLDARILGCTLLRLFGIKGPSVGQLLGVHRATPSTLPSELYPPPPAAEITDTVCDLECRQTVGDVSKVNDSSPATSRSDGAPIHHRRRSPA